MAALTEKRLIRLMRDAYRARLLEAISESDVVDKRGNIVIQRDLKVRHKKTQYEYTVDSVEGQGDNIQIALRVPDAPRFDPPPEGEEILDNEQAEILGEQDPFANPIKDFPTRDLTLAKLSDDAVDEPEADDIFVIDREEFEKEYEVK